MNVTEAVVPGLMCRVIDVGKTSAVPVELRRCRNCRGSPVAMVDDDAWLVCY